MYTRLGKAWRPPSLVKSITLFSGQLTYLSQKNSFRKQSNFIFYYHSLTTGSVDKYVASQLKMQEIEPEAQGYV